MLHFDQRVASLQDLEPLWKELALLYGGAQDLTPFLVPPDRAGRSRVDARATAIEAFAALRRQEITALETLAPDRTRGLRAAWESWWNEHGPNDRRSHGGAA